MVQGRVQVGDTDGNQQSAVGRETDSGSGRGAPLKTQTDVHCPLGLHGLPQLSCPSSVALPVSPGTLIPALGDDSELKDEAELQDDVKHIGIQLKASPP